MKKGQGKLSATNKFNVAALAIIVLITFGLCGKSIAGPPRPLCEFFASYYPGVIGSGMLVYYDGREYDEGWFPPEQRSQGCIKFVIELGYWLTAAERDAMASRVASVEFKNVTKGVEYSIKDAFKYSYTQPTGVPTYNADYVIYLANGQNFVGQWEVKLVALMPNATGELGKATYTANFDLTEDMVYGKPIVRLSDITVHSGNPDYQVCFTPANPHPPYSYRIRMIEGNNIIFDKSYGGDFSPLCPSVPAIYAGKTGRIEARLLYGFKLSCPDNVLVGADGLVGSPNAQQSRNSTYFKLIP
jgi:hypothetical protein